jgi:type VI secretion system FHA domain protein
MHVELEVVSFQKSLMGDGGHAVFDETGGSIGRSRACDWVIADPDRYVSGHHADITFESDGFLVVDKSTNGVFVNGSPIPLGRGVKAPLKSGDHLVLGDFEITVRVESGAQASPAAFDLEPGTLQAPMTPDQGDATADLRGPLDGFSPSKPARDTDIDDLIGPIPDYIVAATSQLGESAVDEGSPPRLTQPGASIPISAPVEFNPEPVARIDDSSPAEQPRTANPILDAPAPTSAPPPITSSRDSSPNPEPIPDPSAPISPDSPADAAHDNQGCPARPAQDQILGDPLEANPAPILVSAEATAVPEVAAATVEIPPDALDDLLGEPPAQAPPELDGPRPISAIPLTAPTPIAAAEPPLASPFPADDLDDLLGPPRSVDPESAPDEPVAKPSTELAGQPGSIPPDALDELLDLGPITSPPDMPGQAAVSEPVTEDLGNQPVQTVGSAPGAVSPPSTTGEDPENINRLVSTIAPDNIILAATKEGTVDIESMTSKAAFWEMYVERYGRFKEELGRAGSLNTKGSPTEAGTPGGVVPGPDAS